MKTLILTFLISVSLISYSQERKIETKKNNFYTEIYSINKINKMKDGSYIKMGNKNDTLIVGNYSNGTKVGIWRFNASSNKPYFCYDFDNKVIDKLPRDINKIDSFYIKKDTAYYLDKVDRAPIYLGYKGEIKDVLRQNISVPFDIFKNGLSGYSIASFVVNSSGKIEDIKIEKSLSQELNSKLFKMVKMAKEEWIPAKVNGKPIDSKIYILCNISQLKKTIDYKEKPYLFVIDVVYSVR